MPAKKANISKILLKLIEAEGEFTSEWESYSEFSRRLYGLSQPEVKRALSNLKYRGLILKSKTDSGYRFELTDLGHASLLKAKYRRLPKEKRSDNLLTVIIFDIPEEKKKARKFLRRFLVENGFTSCQKSVFIGPYLLKREEFEEILREVQVVDCVTVFSGALEYSKAKKISNRGRSATV